MTTEPVIATRATTPGSRTQRRWPKAALVIAITVALAMLFTLGINQTSGGPAYPWDHVLPDVRHFVRGVLAGFMGKSINEDVLP